MRKNCKDFEEWCMSQFDEFITLKYSRYVEYKVVYENPNTSFEVAHAHIYHERKAKCGWGHVKAQITGYNRTLTAHMAIGLAWAEYKGEEIPRKFNREKVQIGTLKAGDKFYTESGTECFVIGTHPLSKYHFITADATYPGKVKTYEAMQCVYVDR